VVYSIVIPALYPRRFRKTSEVFELLHADPEAYAQNVEKHFARHLEPFVASALRRV